jgi:MFS family permease
MIVWYRSRALTQYPRGWLQAGLLTLVVIANIVANYEGQIAPVAPLLLPYLHMSTHLYGLINGLTAVVTGIAAIFLGPWVDRLGRVFFVVAGTAVTALMVLSMALVHTVGQFILVRFVMSMLLGMTLPATTGLVRDFTPRVGRAFGYGLWTFGPVGANYLAAWVAGWTLPLFHNAWQSQFIIMGLFCLVVTGLVAVLIRDLSPALRAEIVHDASAARRLNEEGARATGEVAPARMVYGSLRVWALAVGIVLFLAIYFFVQAFGPLYFVMAFHYDPATAASVSSYFWLVNLGALLAAGWVSDRLQLRKICSFVGVIGLFVYMYVWIGLIGQPVSTGMMAVYASLLGFFLAIGYGPWMAMFSEFLEDIHPTLQASGWAVYSCAAHVLAGGFAIVTFLVVDRYGFRGWFDFCWFGVAVYGLILIALRSIPWLRRRMPKQHMLPTADRIQG